MSSVIVKPPRSFRLDDHVIGGLGEYEIWAAIEDSVAAMRGTFDQLKGV